MYFGSWGLLFHAVYVVNRIRESHIAGIMKVWFAYHQELGFNNMSGINLCKKQKDL